MRSLEFIASHRTQCELLLARVILRIAFYRRLYGNKQGKSVWL